MSLETEIENARVERIVLFVAQKLIERFSRLHLVQKCRLLAVALDLGQAILDRLHRQAQRRDGVDDQVISQRLKRVGREQLGFPKLRHVGQQWNRYRFAKLLELALVRKRLGK